MTAFLVGMFAASFLGSLHCVGMCGPLVGVCSLSSSGRGWALLAYQSARLLSLLVLGAVAGAAGAGLDAAGSLAGLQRAAAVGAGLSMLAWGGLSLARGAGFELPLPGPLAHALAHLHERALRRRGLRGAFFLGAVTPLLPCGWLYLFVLAAAGAGSPLWGALALAAFWAGNLPALTVVGLGLSVLLRRPALRRR
ncbi:MAG: sulfite exporter TauE/SafE family protein, partial [Planctomycetota bacterium]